ncbi:hypothetical protein WAE56_17995 [Iodobacter sp. LRB]|uniref:hypothetical protein n=1 Tax=Iodobacter sp. LRB TaxID=3127955 RepID=UPI00307F3D59
MQTIACKLVLPRLELTEVTYPEDPSARKVETFEQTYYVRPKFVPNEGQRRDGRPTWVHHQFNLFPVVLDDQGVPWAEANIYILSRLEGSFSYVMSTYDCIAADLAAYRRFLDKHDIDWLSFPSNKLFRPTYRFNGYLKFAINAGEIALSTAKRQMCTVVNFYRWLSSEGVFTPVNPPWRESDHYVQFKDAHGFSQSKKVVTTDVHVKVPRQNDPYDSYIDDGGKLYPLTTQQQEWLMDALTSLGNTEMTLIHLFSLLTGARIQTVLTLRVRHALLGLDGMPSELRLPIGPGTGIDTKYSKQMVLHIPAWFYHKLKTYAQSARAKRRRDRAVGGDSPDQYLFLSQRGAPLYRAKDDSKTYDPNNSRHYPEVGQGVRQFITDRIIPFIREKYAEPNFHYQYHDTRATAGMNWTDRQLLLVAQGKATLHEAREFVRVRMGHESSEVTDRYLKYRQNLKLVRWVAEEHESHLQQLAALMMDELK